MKTKIKRHSRSVLSVILAISMLISCMMVGLIATDAARVTGGDDELGATTYYYHYGTDNNYWSSNGVAMTQNGSTWYADIDFTTQYNNYVRINTTSSSINNSNTTSVSNKSTNNYSSVVDKISYYGNVDSGYAGYKIELKSAPSSSTKVRISFDTSDMSTLIVSDPTGGSGGGGEGGGEGGDPSGATPVTNTDLIGVLSGTKIMLYLGEDKNWGDSTYYIMSSNSTSNAIASATRNDTAVDYTNGGYKFALFTLNVPVGNYYMGHWASGLHTTPEAGFAYGIRNKTTTSFDNHTWIMNDSGETNSLYKITAGKRSVATTIASSINQGSTLSVSTGSAGQSAIKQNNIIEYYIKSGSNYYSISASSGVIDTSAFSAGNYTLITVLKDTRGLRVVADSDDFTVIPLASALTLSASKTKLTDVDESTTLTATATDLLSGVAVTYKLFTSDGTQVGSSQSVAAGTNSVNFTVTPNARSTTYYATVDFTSGATANSAVTSNNLTITNSADDYIPRYTIDFQSNNNTYGTVTAKKADGTVLATGDEVKEGESVTFTATAKAGYVFVSWDAFNTNSTSVTRDIYDDMDVKGTFGPKGYQIIAGNNNGVAMRELSNGTFISANTYANDNWFQIVRNCDSKSSVGNNADDSSHCEFISNNDKHTVTSWRNRPDSWNYIGSFANKTGGSRYVVYDPSTEKVWLTSDPDDLYGVTVVAKDGSIRYGYEGTYSSDYGDTTLSAKLGDGTEVSSGNAYDSQARSIDFTANQVREGITLHVTTRVKSAYVSQGYYVKGFVVTGYEESFSVLWQDEDQHQAWINDGYNEFDLTLPEYPAKNVEITPVYWIKETNSGDNVRFYVDGFAGDVYDAWDGNLAIEAYKTNGTPVLGEYPGQPMINYNGRYVVDLPRTDLGGITLNNYVWDRVHSNMFYGTSGTANPDTTNQYLNKIQAANKQTYDFNDFIYIKQALEEDTDPTNDDEDIIFSFRYKYDTSHNTLDTSNHGKLTYYKDSDAAGKPPVVVVDTTYDYEDQASTLDVNNSIYQWENLTDFYQNRVDILGNYVDTKNQNGTSTNPKAAYTNPVRIVSNGYDFSEAGKYATAWAIYVPVDGSNNLAPTGAYHHYQLVEVFGGQGKVTTENNQKVGKWGSSSYLVNPAWTTSLKDKYDYAYSTDTSKPHSDSSFVYDLAKMPTVISYEYSVNSNKSNLNLEGAGNAATDGNPGLRSDGRWYATNSNQLLKAHTIIEYAEKDDDNAYTRDFYQAGGIDYTSSSGYNPSVNTGLATRIQAYFENSNSDTLDTVTFQNTSGDTEAYSISDGEDDHRFLLKTVGDPNGDYTFKGWYLYSNGKYSLVSRSETYASEATANDVYVARYYKTPSGNLNISHQLTSDSKGDATCKAQVRVMNGANPIYTYAYSTDTIKVTPVYIKSTSSYNLEITLKTELGANTLFDKFKEKITTVDLSELIAGDDKLGIDATVEIDTSGTDKIATITFPISALFTGSGAEATQNVKALQFFSKTVLPEYKYEITYNFGSRKLIQNGKLSNNRLWGDQFYKYKGTFTDEEVEQYLDLSGTPTFKSAETANYLAEHSPYEKNFLEDTVWDFNSQTISYNASTLTFSCSLTAAQTTNTDINVTFKLPFDYTLNTTTPNNYTFSVTKASETDKPVYKDYKTVTQHESVTMDFLDWFSLNGVKNKTQMTSENQPEFLKVPDVLYNDATNPTKKRTFKYWAFFKEGDNIDTAEPYQKCYSSALNQAVYQDTVFYPVYTAELEMSAEEIKEVASNKSATITFLGVTRDQWNYNGGNAANSIWGSKFADRIFTDFVLSFEYENKLIPTNNATFRTGLIIQTLDTPEGGIENATPESLAAEYASSDGKDAAITKIKNTASDISESGVGNYLISYNQQALDDRNAIEYYYGIANVSQSTNPTNDTYTNPTTRRNFGYRAYSFIKKGTGSSAEVIISDPVYFTIYDVASIQNGSEQVASGS